MEDSKQKYYSLEDVFSAFRSFVRLLLRKWILLVLFAVAGAGIGLAYFYFQKPRYQAVTTFILEEKTPGGGGLLGLASQFGVNLGSLAGGGGIFSGDNILDILRSKKIVTEVLLSPVDTFSGSKTLADLYADFSGLKRKWGRKIPEAAQVSFAGAAVKWTRMQDSLLNIVYEKVATKHLSLDRTRKQGTIFTVQVSAENELFAKLMSDRLVAAAAKLYLDVRVGTAQQNISQLQKRADSLLMLLNNKSYTAAAIQPVDINPGLRSAVVPTEIVTRDKTVLATIYTEVTKNLEASKLMLMQQMPVIQLLDTPGASLEDNKKSRLFLVAVGAVLAAVICSLILFARFLLQLRAESRGRAGN